MLLKKKKLLQFLSTMYFQSLTKFHTSIVSALCSPRGEAQISINYYYIIIKLPYSRFIAALTTSVQANQTISFAHIQLQLGIHKQLSTVKQHGEVLYVNVATVWVGGQDASDRAVLGSNVHLVQFLGDRCYTGSPTPITCTASTPTPSSMQLTHCSFTSREQTC